MSLVMVDVLLLGVVRMTAGTDIATVPVHQTLAGSHNCGEVTSV